MQGKTIWLLVCERTSHFYLSYCIVCFLTKAIFVVVYPVLSEEGKKEWEQIEEALYREELTSQGYNKYRRRLFQKENFIPLDQSEKDKQEEERNISEMIAEALSSNTVNNTGPEIPAFHSKEECTTVMTLLNTVKLYPFT